MRCCDPTWTRILRSIYKHAVSCPPARRAQQQPARPPPTPTPERQMRALQTLLRGPARGGARAAARAAAPFSSSAAEVRPRRTPSANAPRPRPRLTLTAKWDACRACEARRGGGTGAGRASRAPRSSCFRALLLLQQTLWQRAGGRCCARLGASSAPLATRCDARMTYPSRPLRWPEGAPRARAQGVSSSARADLADDANEAGAAVPPACSHGA